MQMREAGHLGGYVIGGDPATYYPELWDFLIDNWGIKSMLDVGCGEGHALSHFRDRGCRVKGIEGTEQEDPDIVRHDYTLGPLAIYDPFDLAWSCEFVEHVEERFVPNFLATFTCAKLVLLTHAEPGQPGYHHVNNQTSEYWKGAMAATGFTFDRFLTTSTRVIADANPDPFNHYARSGMVFRRW